MRKNPGAMINIPHVMKTLLEAWRSYWFTPDSPAPICLFRIFYGLLLFASGLLWIPDLYTFFGNNGMATISAIRHLYPQNRFSLLFLLPPTDASVTALFLVFMLSTVAVTLGWFTRLSLLISFICLASFDHRNPAIMNSGDTMLRVQGFLLLFSPAGSMFSLDYLRRKKKGIVIDQWQLQTSVWTVRLMQLQVAAVYCQAFCAKIVHESWWNGTALYYVSRLEDYAHFPVPFLFDTLIGCKLLTWGTLVIEFALWTLVWSKKFRYYVLLGGVLLHLGIDWSMNIPIFSYVMISSYLNFVPAQTLKRFLSRILTRFPGPAAIPNP
jgi:hypothetical protein